MDSEAIKSLITAAFPDATVSVELSGGHCDLVVVSTSFEGLRAVARQQRVYAPLTEVIASGALHAVNITAKTPAEVQA
jgi:acid stress-induced BolA-like protein IbaG/YrbA